MRTEEGFSSLRIVLVGAGRVGTAVAELLARAGHQIVAVASRTPDSAHRAGRRLRAPSPDLARLPSADVVLLGVPDGAVTEVAEELPPELGARVVVHFAGALGVEPLAPVTKWGAAPAALHPVQACPDVDTAVRRLPGSTWGVTCGDEIRSWSHDLVSRDLGGTPIDLAEKDRVLWHAGAVVSSNGIAALLAFGERILDSIGVDEPQGVLGPLAAGAVANAGGGGGGAATLTGPAIRGDGETIRRHLDALSKERDGLLQPYEQVTRLIVGEALAAQRISGAAAGSILELLHQSKDPS